MRLALLLLLAATAGAPAPTARVAALRCGEADLRMTSHTLSGPAAPLAQIDQRLTRRVDARQVPVALERSEGVVTDCGSSDGP